MSTKQLIVVLGPDDKGKAHAAKFDMAQAEAVRKAAALMGFRVGIAKSEEAVALAERLPPGKLFAAGKGMVPFCKTETHAELAAALELEPAPVGQDGPKPASTPDKAAPGAAKAPGSDPWAALKVGDKVVAPERKPAEEGWWPCVITSASKDGKTLTLRWLDNPRQPPVTLKRRAVALLPG